MKEVLSKMVQFTWINVIRLRHRFYNLFWLPDNVPNIDTYQFLACLETIHNPKHLSTRFGHVWYSDPQCAIEIYNYYFDIFVWLACRTQFTLIILCCSPYKFFIRNVHCYTAATITSDHRPQKRIDC